MVEGQAPTGQRQGNRPRIAPTIATVVVTTAATGISRSTTNTRTTSQAANTTMTTNTIRMANTAVAYSSPRPLVFKNTRWQDYVHPSPLSIKRGNREARNTGADTNSSSHGRSSVLREVTAREASAAYTNASGGAGVIRQSKPSFLSSASERGWNPVGPSGTTLDSPIVISDDDGDNDNSNHDRRGSSNSSGGIGVRSPGQVVTTPTAPAPQWRHLHPPPEVIENQAALIQYYLDQWSPDSCSPPLAEDMSLSPAPVLVSSASPPPPPPPLASSLPLFRSSSAPQLRSSLPSVPSSLPPVRSPQPLDTSRPSLQVSLLPRPLRSLLPRLLDPRTSQLPGTPPPRLIDPQLSQQSKVSESLPSPAIPPTPPTVPRLILPADPVYEPSTASNSGSRNDRGDNVRTSVSVHDDYNVDISASVKTGKGIDLSSYYGKYYGNRHRDPLPKQEVGHGRVTGQEVSKHSESSNTGNANTLSTGNNTNHQTISRSNNANTNEGIGNEVLYGNVCKNKDSFVLETLHAPPLDSRNDSEVSTRASRAGRKPISFAIRRPTRSLTTVSSRDSTDSDMEISSGPDPDDDPYPVRTRNHRQ